MTKIMIKMINMGMKGLERQIFLSQKSDCMNCVGVMKRFTRNVNIQSRKHQSQMSDSFKEEYL